MKRLLSCAAVAALCAALSPAFAQKKPSDISVETFFKREEYASMQLSPDAKKLGALVPVKGRNNLVVIDIEKKQRNVITSFSNFDVGQFYWINNERICLQVADGQDVSGSFNYRGTYCIDANGENIHNFTKLGITNPDATQGGYTIITPVRFLDDDSNEVIVSMRLRSRYSEDLYRLNTRNARYTLLTDDSPGDVVDWVVDQKGVPRVAVSQPEIRRSSETAVRTVWYRDAPGAKWEKLHETPVLLTYQVKDDFDPLAFDFDDNTLYVAASNGEDRDAIYAYDTKARKLGERLFRHPLIDLGRDPRDALTNGLVMSQTQRRLLGLRYSAQMPDTLWVDPALEKLQKAVDAGLSKTINDIRPARRSDDRALVFSRSDRDPGTYYLLDRRKPAVEFLAKTRDWIDPELMAERRFIQYPARDGMMIPAWITIPKGDGKNLPLIVNIHGGPWVRGYEGVEWGRWPDAQFFASRGYMVLEPEPRGSTGYGRKLFSSSFKQWGQSMQDDISDGALYLAKEGLVDKSRMCLFGGSYGGYASAMGPVKDPDLWKCAAPFVAVTDLTLFQNATYSDMSAQSWFMQTDFLKLVGDSSADKEMFDKSSPARHADRVKAPIFIAMGSSDVRVPQAHGDAFVAALRAAGKKVEYVVYNGEGHGFNKDENVFDFYKRVEKFFAENLKPGS